MRALPAVLALGSLAATTCLVGTTAAEAGSDSARVQRASITLKLAGTKANPQSGPRTFQVTNKTIGVGPELTVADETANPSGFCGDLQVDITRGNRTIKVGNADEVCDFGQVILVIKGDFDRVRGVEDDLFDTEMVNRNIIDNRAGVRIVWTTTDGNYHDTPGDATFTYR